eukprot:601144-Pelagomonas_calceolata.AAC.2
MEMGSRRPWISSRRRKRQAPCYLSIPFAGCTLADMLKSTGAYASSPPASSSNIETAMPPLLAGPYWRPWCYLGPARRTACALSADSKATSACRALLGALVLSRSSMKTQNTH